MIPTTSAISTKLRSKAAAITLKHYKFFLTILCVFLCVYIITCCHFVSYLSKSVFCVCLCVCVCWRPVSSSKEGRTGQSIAPGRLTKTELLHSAPPASHSCSQWSVVHAKHKTLSVTQEKAGGASEVCNFFSYTQCSCCFCHICQINNFPEPHGGHGWEV